jgi:hypothetical protein
MNDDEYGDGKPFRARTCWSYLTHVPFDDVGGTAPPFGPANHATDAAYGSNRARIVGFGKARVRY